MAAEEQLTSTKDGDKLSEVEPNQIADEKLFEFPEPWFLFVMAVAKGAMTVLAISGAFFFLLSDPVTVTPRCYEWSIVPRCLCTFSTICFWTYPVACCIFAVVIFQGYMYDARTYYEFLLHEVVIGYPRLSVIEFLMHHTGVQWLFLYMLFALTTFFWIFFNRDVDPIRRTCGSMAYLAPAISFLSVLLANWTVEGNIVTLPMFLVEYSGAKALVNRARWYRIGVFAAAFDDMETELKTTEATFNTGQMVALMERQLAKSVMNDVVASRSLWNHRFLMHYQLQDSRASSFRLWANLYRVFLAVAMLFGFFLLFCCVITALDLTHAVPVKSSGFQWMDRWTLGPGHFNLNAEMITEPGVRYGKEAVKAIRAFRRTSNGGHLAP